MKDYSIEKNLMPLPLTHQNILWKRLIESQYSSKYTKVSNVNFFLDSESPNCIIVNIERRTWMKGAEPSGWEMIDDIFIDETHSHQRDEMLQYYPKTHIDAPSIGFYHSQFQQVHSLYQQSFAMITAWNPNNESHDESFNRDAHRRLQKILKDQGYSPIECVGYLDDHREEGFLIPSITFKNALELGSLEDSLDNIRFFIMTQSAGVTMRLKMATLFFLRLSNTRERNSQILNMIKYYKSRYNNSKKSLRSVNVKERSFLFALSSSKIRYQKLMS